MSRGRRNLSWALWLLAPLVGCTGTETGNPPRTTISFQMVTSEPSLIALASDHHEPTGEGGASVGPSPEASVVVSLARLGVERLSVQACGETERLDLDVTETVDFTDDEARFDVPLDSLCAVELILAPKDLSWDQVGSGGSAALAYGISGAVSDQTVFFVQDAQPTSVAFSPNVVELPADSRLSLALDVATLLDPGELLQLPADENGVLLLDETGQFIDALDGVRERWSASWELRLADPNSEPTTIATGREL